MRLCRITGHHPAELQHCAEDLIALHEEAHRAVDLYNPLTAVKEKYRHRVWHYASHESPLDRASVVLAVVTASKSYTLAGMRDNAFGPQHA